MARLIPPLYNPARTSLGEIRVFERLRDEPGTEAWTVLHSLDMVRHSKKIAAEADFVVLAPGAGVLALEVKGCRSLKRTPDGLWFYGDDPQPDTRGPFKQAMDAAFTLRRTVLAQAPELRNTVFGSGVVLPFVQFSESSSEWQPWQVVDSKVFSARPLGVQIAELLAKTRENLQNHGVTADHALTPEECKRILRILRPSFETIQSPKARARELEEELLRYTEEQYAALDDLEQNERIVFRGPAGTGKTLLAMEAARRAVANGRRTLLLCYNKLLGSWLAHQTEALAPLITCRTLHGHMLSVAGDAPPPGAPKAYWREDLPEKAIGRLIEAPSRHPVFDELIVDEAQDVMHEPYLDFLDLCLSGGLDKGRWRLFGDFEKQAIYALPGAPPAEVMGKRLKSATISELRTNCRNRPRLATFIHLLSRLIPNYRAVRRPDDGVEPDLEFHPLEAQPSKLTAWIAHLLTQGYRERDIVILSPRDEQACTAARLKEGPFASRIRPLVSHHREGLCFTTIQAFKGMEAPAVIITDLDTILGDWGAALLYVAMTRALNRLVLLATDEVRAQMSSVLHAPA